MRTCGVCISDKRPLVDDALLRRISCQRIADEHGFNMDQVWRHSQHLDRDPVVVIDKTSANLPLMDRIENLIHKLELIASAATTEKAWQAAVAGLSELRRCLELLGRLSGQLQSGGQQIRVGVAVSVSAGHSTSSLSEFELEENLAREVGEATNGFDPATIARLQRIAESSTSRDLPDVPLQLTENAEH